jgi:hypothetical protein
MRVIFSSCDAKTTAPRQAEHVRGKRVDVRPNWKEQPVRPTKLDYC